MNSTKSLLQFDFDAEVFARRAPERVRMNQQTIDTLLKIKERHDDTGHKLPDLVDLRKIYLRFNTAHRIDRLHTEFNSLKRTRQLAWALTYSEGRLPRIVDTPQLSDALRLISDRYRTSALRGVFDALLQAWNTPNAGMLREFVKKHLTDYNGSRKFVQKLKANMEWYCEDNGAKQLAEKLYSSGEKLSDVWSVLELPDHSYSYSYFGAVAMAYVSIGDPRNVGTVADIVNFTIKHNNDKTSRSVLSKLITVLGFDAPENLRQPVQSYVLREWGDPRISGGDVRWRDVSDEARRIFTRWIMKEDLHFFFDVVAKACNDEKFAYRKAFWLAYLEHITFCRPVLRQNAEYLFRNDPQALEYYRGRRPATLTGGTHDQHAFIIQMGNYTFVEFSTDGACYIYDNSRLPFRLDNSEYTMDTWRENTLRDQSLAKYRVIHRNSENYYWQDNLESWLKSEFGIKPLRSYQL